MAIGTATAILGAAAIGAIGSAVGGNKAAGAQRDAANAAANTELEMFNRNVELQEPWRQAGIGALRQLRTGTRTGGDFNRDFTLSDFVRDPGYEFRMDEGMRGVEASAAARGGALSGGALKGIQRFGQDFASGEFSNAYNRFNADRDRRFGRLSQLAGVGQTATGQLTDAGSGAAGRIGDYQTQSGNARASGYVGAANAVNQGLSTAAQWWRPQAQQPASFGPRLDSFFSGTGGSGD